jgi:uncharacterized protein (DUF2252 family)
VLSRVDFSIHAQPPSATERRAAGRAARDRLKPGELASWVRAGSMNPVAIISAQNQIRLAELLPIRHARMAESPWAYYRGAAAVMAADLASRADTGLIVQLGGDAHILNFGMWATPERRLSFDLRDFDETLPGPFEWDVSRLVASIVVLARATGLDARDAEQAVARCLQTYRDRIGHYTTARQLDIWYDLISAQQFVALFAPEEQEQVSSHIERKASRRTSAGAARKLTERVGGRLRIIEDPPLRVRLQAYDPALVAEVFEAYRASLPEYRRHLLDRFSVVDAARQVVGVGSVGMRVFLILLQGRDGDDPLFLQIKQADKSVYEAYRGPSHHQNHGERVVIGKRLIQSATDIFAGYTSVSSHDFYVRQFRDMKVIPNGDLIAPPPRFERQLLLRPAKLIRDAPLRRVGVDQPPDNRAAEHLPQSLSRLEPIPFRDRQPPRVHISRREINEPDLPEGCRRLPEQPAQPGQRDRLRLMHLQVLADQLAERHRRCPSPGPEPREHLLERLHGLRTSREPAHLRPR